MQHTDARTHGPDLTQRRSVLNSVELDFELTAKAMGINARDANTHTLSTVDGTHVYGTHAGIQTQARSTRTHERTGTKRVTTTGWCDGRGGRAEHTTEHRRARTSEIVAASRTLGTRTQTVRRCSTPIYISRRTRARASSRRRRVEPPREDRAKG